MNAKEKTLLMALAIISVGAYLLVSAQSFGPGFPLDDSWIHQTYARNLVRSAEWSFLPAVPSAGATSFLWVILLALGYLLGAVPFLWTFILGGVLLFALSLTGWKAAKFLLPASRRWPILIGVFLLFEWHLVWSAVSGMETLLFTWLATLVLSRLFVLPHPNHLDAKYWWISGGLMGLASLTRPEGITLLAPFVIAIMIYLHERSERLIALTQSLLAFSLVFLPLLLFNFKLSGNLWPNTFYAKQAEYAILLEQPLLNRVIEQFSLPLVGAGVLLLPAFLFLIFRALKEGNWVVLLWAGWAAGFLALYALRLPVTFQHGRYVIPMMPIYFILSLTGLAQWLRFNSQTFFLRVASRVWLLAIVIVQLAFWGLGARAYSQDVAFIESEMVATAHWLAENTPADSLVAAHDIGALGYFAERPLIDLAGLVSPEVIPFLRDEDRIFSYLNQRGAEYLVTFPDWYPNLIRQSEMVFQSSGTGINDSPFENMTVFLWTAP